MTYSKMTYALLLACLPAWCLAAFPGAPCPGDLNSDGQTDLMDFEDFADCMDGPEQSVAPGCDLADISNDNDVDMVDFAVFQTAFGCVVPTPTQLTVVASSASSTGPAGPVDWTHDGNPGTRWESIHGIDPSWVVWDLGSSFSLTEIVIDWEAANAATYEVQGSNDSSSWTTLASETGGTFGDRTDIVTLAGSYRYVRMFGQTRSSPYGYSIWETEIYGLPPVDTDGDGVDDSIDQCPGTPFGTPVASTGCPDSDGDGVDDLSDACPNTPPGAQIDIFGCEIVIPVNEVASINDILVGGSGSSQPGFALYVFDDDLATPGSSSCTGGCATNWPPLLVNDGLPSGVADLGSITRANGDEQVTHNGRPLYFYAGDAAPGDTSGDGAGGVWHIVPYVQVYAPLFDENTPLEPMLQEDTPTALITRLSDRARDRHHREGQFMAYDHYLSFYWEHRTAEIEIVDTIGKGGNTITFNVITEWPVNPIEAELRFFHLNAAIYCNNGIMTSLPQDPSEPPGSTRSYYTRSVNFNCREGRALQVGDRMEFELSQFLTGTPNGRDNYYGTAILYVVGQGVEPWEGVGTALNPEPMPAAGRLGGDTTLSYQYSQEPDNHFMQMATNLSNINGQVFVRGRRVLHTDVGDGSHDEAAENASFPALTGLLGPNYVNRSCISCHTRNGRGLPPNVGGTPDQYVFKIGDATGNPTAAAGSVLQPLRVGPGASEGGVTLSGWTENGGLRSPNWNFSGTAPATYSARIAPQLVGLGLLEAIEEADIEALADPADNNADGISGRMHIVTDAETGEDRVGRFGWKATMPTVRHQSASALNTDLGVMTSVFPDPDCGSAQSGCGTSGGELPEAHLQDLAAYISLLGVSARRDLDDAEALLGEVVFDSINCSGCHTPSFTTTPFHPHAELSAQIIYPYTDLLLHDMGPGLASSLGEGNASGAEWRTPPLWNIGLVDGVSGGEGYLHDGRARTLEEAILWHGGEGEASKQAYEGLSQNEKDALIKFLKSL